MQWKSISCPYIIHPAWWAGGCWFTLKRGSEWTTCTLSERTTSTKVNQHPPPCKEGGWWVGQKMIFHWGPSHFMCSLWLTLLLFFFLKLVTFYFYVLCNNIKNKCTKAFTYLPNNSLGLAINCPFQNTSQLWLVIALKCPWKDLIERAVLHPFLFHHNYWFKQ
jgi:hypothetical protein